MLGHHRNVQAGDPNELLQAQAVLMVPITHTAWALHYRWGDYIRPPEPGRYFPGQMTPIIRADKQYTSKHFPTVTLMNVDEVKDDLHDMQGRWVLPASVMRESKNQLLKHPTVPTTALKLVKALINLYIVKQSPWADNRQAEMQVYDCLQGECEFLINDNVLEYDIDELLVYQVGPFVQEHEWFIHNLRFAGTDLVIERQGDFRAYQWTLDMHNKQQTQTD